MRLRNLRRLASLCLSALLLAGGWLTAWAAYARAPTVQIWFSPKQDNVVSDGTGVHVVFTKYDFGQMVASQAAWQTAASRLALMSLNIHAPEHFADLPALVAMANRSKFQISLSGSAMFTDGKCAKEGMEGLDASSGFARELVAAVRKWKEAGGRLDYVDMDSPFYFGYYASAKSCHFSIAEVARRTAATVSEIRKLYPKIKLMDAEGPGPKPMGPYLADFQKWLDAFKVASGKPMESVAMDMHWKVPGQPTYDWTNDARQMAAMLHKNGVQAGMYINDTNEKTNADWMAVNRQHLAQAAHGNLGIDYVFIASWANFPDRNLPESDQSAYVSLINDAFTAFGGTR